MRTASLALAALVSIGASSCGGTPEGDGPLGAARQAQIDPGDKVWRQIVLTFGDGTQLATIYVFNQALGSYTTGHEYWFVNKGSLGDLGTAGLSIAVTDETSMTAPPDPGYGSEQKFVLAENVSWGSGWTTDPRSGGSLYTGYDANGDALALRLYTSGTPAKLSAVVWYQILASGSPANITPSGSFSTATGSVSVPSGETGYDIAQNTGG
jgi:hypothetical protein